MLDILPIAILILHFTDKWFLAKGSLWKVYCVTIIGSSVAIVYNIMLLGEMNGNHKTILLFAINSIWTIAMGLSGISRLLKEKKLSL